MENQCNGRGFCLKQTLTNDEDGVEIYHKHYDCQYNCEPIKCPNFKVCNTLNPQCILDCHNGRCYQCNMLFGNWNKSGGCGNLNFIDNIECPICFENKEGVCMPRCDHYICIDCFKRIYFKDHYEEISFPYSDKESYYYDYLEENDIVVLPDEKPEGILFTNEEWLNIIEWNNNDNLAYERAEQQHNSEKNLRFCSICRK